MKPPAVVTTEEWLTARKALLVEEKKLTRARDDLARQRRELPWVKLEKNYDFQGPEGRVSLADLFAGRSQLIVQHFMFGPGWEEGCIGCSFLADHADSANQHLQHHDVTFVGVSRAPWPEIEIFRKRMEWQFPWYSSFGSDFNYDFHVSFTPEQLAQGTAYANYRFEDPGIDEISAYSVFYRDEAGVIYHTYSTFSRGCELFAGAYLYLDITPKGRNENGPRHNLTDWVRHHDRYGMNDAENATGCDREADAEECCGCGKEGVA